MIASVHKRPFQSTNKILLSFHLKMFKLLHQNVFLHSSMDRDSFDIELLHLHVQIYHEGQQNMCGGVSNYWREYLVVIH